MFGKISAVTSRRRCRGGFPVGRSVHEAGVGTKQLGDEAAQRHETSASLREVHLTAGRDLDVAGLALLVDAAIDCAHLHHVALDEGALELISVDSGVLLLLYRREQIDADRSVHRDWKQDQKTDVEAER